MSERPEHEKKTAFLARWQTHHRLSLSVIRGIYQRPPNGRMCARTVALACPLVYCKTNLPKPSTFAPPFSRHSPSPPFLPTHRFATKPQNTATEHGQPSPYQGHALRARDAGLALPVSIGRRGQGSADYATVTWRKEGGRGRKGGRARSWKQGSRLTNITHPLLCRHYRRKGEKILYVDGMCRGMALRVCFFHFSWIPPFFSFLPSLPLLLVLTLLLSTHSSTTIDTIWLSRRTILCALLLPSFVFYSSLAPFHLLLVLPPLTFLPPSPKTGKIAHHSVDRIDSGGILPFELLDGRVPCELTIVDYPGAWGGREEGREGRKGGRDRGREGGAKEEDGK